MGNLACVSGNKADDRDATTATSFRTPRDGYEARMRIEDDILMERYRHKMPCHRQRQRPPGCSRHRLTFRADSYESCASSTESERGDFLLSLVDSLPETFLDEDESDKTPPLEPPMVVLVSAQVNEYVDSRHNLDDSDNSEEVFETPAAGTTELSESAHSSTYESIKSMELGEGSRERALPPSPPPPQPQVSTSAGRQASRKASGKVKARQSNGPKGREFQLPSRIEQAITG